MYFGKFLLLFNHCLGSNGSEFTPTVADMISNVGCFSLDAFSHLSGFQVLYSSSLYGLALMDLLLIKSYPSFESFLGNNYECLISRGRVES